MAGVMAIVSRAVFEKQAAGAGLGAVLGIDQYTSQHKALAPLGTDGTLFLVTVRPPDEALWLVAVLESPRLGATGWTAKPNRIAITDISALKTQLRFATGTGIQAKPGALGMSLQTPRALTSDDIALLRAAAKLHGGPPGTVAAASATTTKAAAATAAATAIATAAAAAAAAATATAAATGTAAATATAAAAAAKKTAAAKPKGAAAKAKATAKPKAATARPRAVTAKETTAADDGGPGIAAVRAAIADGDGEAALIAALAWWRAERAPAIADLVDRISERVSGPAVADDIEFTKVAGARDPRVLGRLLPAVPDLPVYFLPTAAQMLVEFPEDPRLSAAFATWIRVPITTSTSKNMFWTKLFARVQALGDTRIVRPLKARLSKEQPTSLWWDRYYGAIERTVAKLAAITPPAVDDKAIAPLVAGVKRLDPSGAGTGGVVTAVASGPAPSDPLLAQAAVHLGAGRIVDGIEAMVARWRETRVPALADLIDRATPLLPSHDRPLVTSRKTAQAEWRAAFEADPAANLPGLLQSFAVDGTLAPLHVAQLGALPDDPRISCRLAEMINRQVADTNAKYWGAVFEIIARHRDVRTFAPMEAIFGDFSSTYFRTERTAKRYLAKLVGNPASGFDTWPLAYTPEDESLASTLAAAIDAQRAPTRDRERALVAAIADGWGDDGPRLVYADWLLEREHPRGELIVLATKATRTPAETARLDELKARRYLLGAVEDLCDRSDEEYRLDRGLLARAKVNYDCSSLTYVAAAQHPLVALLDTLVMAPLRDPTPESFQALIAAATRLRVIEFMDEKRTSELFPQYREAGWRLAGSGDTERLERPA